MTKTFPVQPVWRFTLLLLPALGLFAIGAATIEWLGIVERGTLLDTASEAERWTAFVVGVLLLPWGLSALPHARLTIDDQSLHHLGFGVLCTTRTIRFDDVRRWGHAVARNRGRREPMLAFELHTGDVRLVKLAMYRSQQEIRQLLTAALGEPAPATATMTGVRFDEPAR